MLKAHISKPQQNLKIKLYSILLGSDQFSAEQWKLENEIFWTVLYDIDAKTIKRYCPLIKLPCVLIHHPQKGIFYLEQKIVHFEELTLETGPWEE